MPQSTKREGFVLGPKGRLRSAAKQEPPTAGETPCLYDNKKEQSMTAQILLAEREGWSPLYHNTSQHAVTLYYYNVPT